MRGNKKGAIEMSVGTIVTIVLSMSMLILGMVLIKNIFSGSSSNVLEMNDNVRDQINKLFSEDKKVVVYASNKLVAIKQDEQWGVPFGIKNLVTGNAEGSTFDYEVFVSDADVQSKCGISESEAQGWIVAGRSGSISLAPGDSYSDIVRFFIPEGSPLCIVRFQLKVTVDGKIYAADNFDVEVSA